MNANIIFIFASFFLVNFLLTAAYMRWLFVSFRRKVYLDVMEFLIRQGFEEEPVPPSYSSVPPEKPSNRDHLRLIS